MFPDCPYLRGMKISASVYANSKRPLADLVRDLDLYGVDFLHIDCKDNPGVFADIARIREVSPTPIDLHLITSEPERYLHDLHQHELAYVTFQYEDLRGPEHLPRPVGYKQGIAITSETPIEVFDKVMDRCDFVLFMTTIPGESGGSFQRENFQRIRRFMRRYPGIDVHVDGGVNAEVGFILRNMGVSLIVSGSYLVRSQSIGASMLKLKAEAVDSHYYVEDFMLDLNDTPVLVEEKSTFLDALRVIEHYSHGLVIITDTLGKFKGLVTNADVRRGLLRHSSNLNQVKLPEIVNRNPLTIHPKKSVSELLTKVKHAPFPVNYLPVVDSHRKVVGLVAFFNLIKGEG